MAVSQSGRPGSPLYRKAVTVWMLTAQGMESRITGLIQRGRRHFLALGAQGDEGDDGIQHQVSAKRDHVPEHDGVRRGIEQHVEHARGLAHVHEDEEHAHHDGGDGQELAQDGDAGERLAVVQIIGEHDHHGGSRDTHQEGELGDVEAPGDIAAEARDSETVVQLPQVAEEAGGDDRQQEQDPEPVPAASHERFFKQ